MRVNRRLVGDEGVAVLEVLIAAVVLGVATIGIALMFSKGGSFIIASGDDRVAIYLAKQKIEDLKTLSFACIPIGGPGTAKADIGPNTGCTATRVYNEPQVAGNSRHSRTTVVACADPLANFAVSTCPQSGRRITVTVGDLMAEGRQITIESGLTVH